MIAFVFYKNIIPLNEDKCNPVLPHTGEQGVAYIPMPKGRGFTPHLVRSVLACYNIRSFPAYQYDLYPAVPDSVIVPLEDRA